MINNKKSSILEAFYFRHACKEFDPERKITDEDFSFILETARLSPSSFGYEPWKFLIIQNPDLREKLKPVSWGAQRQLPTASHFMVLLARKAEDMKTGSPYLTHLLKDLMHMPESSIDNRNKVYQKFLESDFHLLEHPRLIFEWTCRQTYLALANMMTAAAQIGIDSCPIEGFDRNQVEAILRNEGLLSHNHFGVSCLAAFGYRMNEPREKTRQPIQDIVQWVV